MDPLPHLLHNLPRALCSCRSPGVGRVPGVCWLWRAGQRSPAGSVTSQNRSTLMLTGATSLGIQRDHEAQGWWGQRNIQSHKQSRGSHPQHHMATAFCGAFSASSHSLPDTTCSPPCQPSTGRYPGWALTQGTRTDRAEEREGWNLPGPHHHTHTGSSGPQVTPHVAYSR